MTATIRAALDSVREPERAPAMQAYMKSEMPYLGVRYSPLRLALSPIFAELEYSNSQEWRTDVLMIWHAAEFREERYAAIELCSARAARQFQRCRDRLELYEELIVNGAWWDYVDPVAGALFWPLLRDDRKEMTSAMRGWSRSADIWNRF
nr:DNA alkylation repair protein [Bradyrhizobium japonicum]